MGSHWTFLPALIIGCTLYGPPAALAADDDAVLQRGKLIAEGKCARCHAVGRTGDSPFKQAPPFPTIAKRYDVYGLAEALAEGILVGHPEMPEFVLPPNEIDDLLTYMDSFSD